MNSWRKPKQRRSKKDCESKPRLIGGFLFFKLAGRCPPLKRYFLFLSFLLTFATIQSFNCLEPQLLDTEEKISSPRPSIDVPEEPNTNSILEISAQEHNKEAVQKVNFIHLLLFCHAFRDPLNTCRFPWRSWERSFSRFFKKPTFQCLNHLIKMASQRF